ncbi:UNVERIFIED_CONTAM: Protein transport protein SEC31 B, partial [Sesamum indicum]
PHNKGSDTSENAFVASLSRHRGPGCGRYGLGESQFGSGKLSSTSCSFPASCEICSCKPSYVEELGAISAAIIFGFSVISTQQKPVIATLTRLFNETSEALGGSRANPAKKREIEDNSKKLGALFAKLNSGDISKNAAEKLVQLCQALDNGDFGTALQIQDQEPFTTEMSVADPFKV